MLVIGQIVAVIRSAENDFKEAAKYNDIFSLGLAAYSTQQACEKLLKIQLYRNNSNYKNKEYKTHNILAILRKCNGSEYIIPNEIFVYAKDIIDWETSGRYGDCSGLDPHLVRHILNICKEWVTVLVSKGYK